MRQLSIQSSVVGAPRPHVYLSGSSTDEQALAGVAVPDLRQHVVALRELDARIRVERLDVRRELVDDDVLAGVELRLVSFVVQSMPLAQK